MRHVLMAACCLLAPELLPQIPPAERCRAAWLTGSLLAGVTWGSQQSSGGQPRMRSWELRMRHGHQLCHPGLLPGALAGDCVRLPHPHLPVPPSSGLPGRRFIEVGLNTAACTLPGWITLSHHKWHCTLDRQWAAELWLFPEGELSGCVSSLTDHAS